MILIDANYFLRWFLNDVPNQNEQVKQLLAEAKPESIIMDRITIAEITYFLRSLGYSHQQVARAIKEFYLIESVQPLDKMLNLALDIFAATNLDFEDCWLATSIQHSQTTLATFDKQLQRFVQKLSP